MNDVARTLGGRLRAARGDLSQAEAATKIGVNKTLLGKYERGESVPGADALTQIRRGLDVSVDWLLTGDGPMRPGADAAATDEEVLVCAIEAVEEYSREKGIPLTPGQKAVLVSSLYALEVEHQRGAGENKPLVAQLFRLMTGGRR
mgnify:CR=1 FL=1